MKTIVVFGMAMATILFPAFHAVAAETPPKLAAGAKAPLVCEDVGQHDFPVSAYPAVRAWLRGPAME
jgi:hypothetical protein